MYYALSHPHPLCAACTRGGLQVVSRIDHFLLISYHGLDASSTVQISLWFESKIDAFSLAKFAETLVIRWVSLSDGIRMFGI